MYPIQWITTATTTKHAEKNAVDIVEQVPAKYFNRSLTHFQRERSDARNKGERDIEWKEGANQKQTINNF